MLTPVDRIIHELHHVLIHEEIAYFGHKLWLIVYYIISNKIGINDWQHDLSHLSFHLASPPQKKKKKEQDYSPQR